MNKLVLFNNTSTVDTGDASVTDFTDVVDQQIAAFDVDDIQGGTLDLTSETSADRVILVQGDDEDPIATMAFDVSDVKRVVTKAYQAYTNQVTNIGFPGSGSNDLSYSEGDEFVKLTRLEKGFEQFPRTTADITIDSADESYDVAHKIAKDFNGKEGAKSFVRAEVLVNDTSSQLVDDVSGANVTLDVTEGSTIVIANVTSGEEVSANAGDYLRIGGATGTTNPVYEIISIETNDGSETELEIEIDRPYGSEDDTGVAAGTLDNGITDNEAGIELTAKDVEEVEDFVESFAAVSFATALSDGISDSALQISTTPQTGSGTYIQMREYERQAAGIQYGFYYRNYFPQTPEYYADDSTNYDIETVVVELDNDNAVVNQNRYLEIVTAWDTGASIGTSLETFFGV